MTWWDDVLGQTTGMAGGPFTEESQRRLAGYLDGAEVRLTTSCTDALEMSAILAPVEPGDVVMVPSFGFVTTALAFVRAGAIIRYIDIEPSTLGMDPVDVARKLDDRVKAIVPIHYAGIPCRVPELVELLPEQAVLIEDNAHGLFGSLDGKPLGTFGAMSCLSFHATKNVSCGEGGALVLNDASLVERADIVLEKGTDRRLFQLGMVDKYTWRDLGSSFGMSDYLAAVLLTQLDLAAEIQAARLELCAGYDRILGPHQEELGFSIPQVPTGAMSAVHLYYVVLAEQTVRDDVVKRLNEAGTRASFHYPPLHLSSGGQRWGEDRDPACPQTERIAASLVRLPLDHRMSDSDVERASRHFLEAIKSLTSPA